MKVLVRPWVAEPIPLRVTAASIEGDAICMASVGTEASGDDLDAVLESALVIAFARYGDVFGENTACGAVDRWRPADGGDHQLTDLFANLWADRAGRAC